MTLESSDRAGHLIETGVLGRLVDRDGMYCVRANDGRRFYSRCSAFGVMRLGDTVQFDLAPGHVVLNVRKMV